MDNFATVVDFKTLNSLYRLMRTENLNSWNLYKMVSGVPVITYTDMSIVHLLCGDMATFDKHDFVLQTTKVTEVKTII